MKINYIKAFILLVTFLTASSSFSQNAYSEKYPKWRLGFNMGGIWQTNDFIKNKAGLAGGFNIERILNKKENALLGFSLGFRYLGGSSYGIDNRKNLALKSNKALNGITDSTLNYFAAPGYFYNNYKTKHGEGALELKMNFPKFEKRTNIVFHLWGGIGLAKYTTKINALNGDSMYNYTNLSTQPSISDIQAFYDKTYETVADGNTSTGSTVFAPSCGIGLGYRFSKNVALVFEHKITFPRVDVIDGQQWKDNISTTPKNDYYHYTAAHLIFTIYGRSHKNTTSPINTNTNNNVTANNNTPKPIINIYTPVTNPYTTTSNIQQVSGSIKYVTTASNISVTINGAPFSNFEFNPNNGSIAFNSNLLYGTNNVTITASNAAGQDSETLEISCTAPQINNQPVLNELPPKVSITYPSNNYVSTTSSTNVNAVITNVSSSANVAISVNGTAISNFNFNSFSGALTFVAALNAGNNSIIVSAFNTAGNDAQQVFVKFSPISTNQITTPKGEPKPVVSFHNPSSSPFESSVKPFNVTAHVTNVTAANQINVVYNGTAITDFTFSAYGFVNFNVSLNTGSNTVSIIGTNNSGSDVKTATINYKEAGKPPVVTVVEPIQTPIITEALNATIVATIENVQNQGDINVMLNNSVVPFTYNTINKTATIQASLNVGKNTVNISAVNSFGSDSKLQVLERTVKVERKPLVTIINPVINPSTSVANIQQIVAHVLNVSVASNIQVSGAANAAIPFTFDITTQQVSFPVNLVAGSNLYTIVATNTAGSDSKSVTINYTPKSTPVLVKPPVISFVNPSINPFSIFDASVNVIASAINVTNQQELSVKLNDANVNFSFDSATKEIQIPTALVMGNNTITIIATTLGGSDSKTQIIERKEITRCLLNPVVNIITPQANPFNTVNSNENVRAEVLNVMGASSIQVLNQQGQVVNFTYDNATHYVNFVANLIAGGNLFTIKATNNIGSDEKVANIVFTKISSATQTPVKVNKPIVNFVLPTQVNSDIQVSAQSISASILNVPSVTGVSVQVNGESYSSFTFVNGVLSFTLNCNEGNNTVTVVGTNSAGSDTKTIFVNYIKPAPPLPLPVVSIVSPVGLSSVASASTYSVQSTILNISSASQAQVKVNGATISGFTYSNGLVNFVANLSLGVNTIFVKATNASGSDSKTVTILYEKKEVAAIVNPPVISYVIPSSASSITVNSSENIRMTVTNVSASSQISVKVNGLSINNFTFNYGVINFNSDLTLGSNSIVVTATNNGGSDSKTLTIARLTPPAPSVTITSPSINPYNSLTPNLDVTASVANVAGSSEISVSVAGTNVPFTYDATSDVLNFSYMVTGSTTFVVSASNANGSDSKNLVIDYVPNGPKIPICHYPNGPTSTPQSISILQSDWPIHAAHGDSQGSCIAAVNPPVVSFIIPASVSSTSQNGNQNITANVTNITSASQVNVLFNNSAVTNFTLTNGNVSFVSSLSFGTNTITITATNAAGSDSKTVTILYEKKEIAALVIPPVLSYVVPSGALSTTINSVENVKMAVANVSVSSQIAVKLNGTTLNNFTMNSGIINFNADLNLGSNTIVVTATNNGGNDSKTVTITRQPPPAPTVTITSPVSNPFNSLSPNVNVTASVANVAGSSEISVSIAGTTVPFTYNASSDALSFSYMITSSTTFVISASNANGSDSRSLIIDYVPNGPKIPICHYPNGPTSTPQSISILQSDWPIHDAHGDLQGSCATSVNAPVVNFIIPASSATTTQNNTQNITANVTNVTMASQVSVLFNNSPISNFTLVNGNVSFVSALLLGLNTVIVTATNTGGTDSKTITITRQAPPGPAITITSPTVNPYSSTTPNINVTATVANVTYASEINVTANGSTVQFNYNVVSDVLSFDHTVTGNTTFVITASNSNGTASKSIVVNYQDPNGPKIRICHYPNGPTSTPESMSVLETDWPIHAAHGDSQGNCPVQTTTTPNNGNGTNENKGGTILNGIKGIINTPKTNTNTNSQPTNTTPKNNQEPVNSPPKTTSEPKKDEPKVIPRTVQPTPTNTVAPTESAPVKTVPTSTVNEGSAPRVIKPR